MARGITISSFVVLLLAASVAATAAPSASQVLQQHIEAIKARDMAGIEATITAQDSLQLILPNGKRTATRAEYLAFHEEFFASSSWSMRFEPVFESVGKDLAVFTVHSYYSDVEDGKPVTGESWLTFVFKLEQRRWRLVSDQNTRIPR
ncbi:MAG TPA: nuclear transport factor 2 family protein [Steroidobacteraceae bacterium]|nr:nuclear transport factor 2 family protein [Steroidobacteraceae bacterium]HRX88550.1 nuclear transport factor 2 family protein [Steroidobacteraceae bacterium]